MLIVDWLETFIRGGGIVDGCYQSFNSPMEVGSISGEVILFSTARITLKGQINNN